MNSLLLYQWNEMIDKHFPEMGRWQKRTLASLSYGIIAAESCRLGKIAQKLTGKANASSTERQLQRWMANERIVMRVIFKWWIGWIVQCGEKPPF
jgi:hypothetical protein